MANINSKIDLESERLPSPINFADSTDDSGTTRANIDLIIELLSYEGAEESIKRLALDTMTHQARVSMVAVLKALKASCLDP